MSASSRRVAVALTVTLFGWPLRGQSSSDKETEASPQEADTSPRSSREILDRPPIDAAMIVRERGAWSLADVLTSRVPGIHVVPGSGVNGMGSRIRFRGVQSLVTDRAPLVLVDGMRVDGGEDAFSASVPSGSGYVFGGGGEGPLPPGPLRLDDLNPEDIEDIEVLPGPASTALYGPGANAGVLLIHTRRGRPGPPRWEGYAQGGVRSEPARWPANFGGVDSDHPDTRFQHGACTLDAQTRGWCVQDFVQQFNPFAQRSPFRTALRRQYGLSVSGGSARADYRVAGEFAGDAGPYSARVASPDPNYHRRLNVRASGRVRPWPTLELGVNAARMSSDLRLPPDLALQVGLAGPSDSTGFDWSRMFRLRSTQAVDRWSGVFEARWSPLPWIGVRGLAGVDAVAQRDTALWPYSAAEPSLLGWLAEGERHMRHRTLELVASVTRALSSATLSTTTVGVQHLRDSLAQELNLGTDGGAGFGNLRESAALWQKGNSLGYYVEERLGFNRKLFLSAAVRHDKFKEEKRSATHPSFALSWVARAVDSARVSLVRLRAAYGSAGPRPFDGMPLVVVPIGTPIPRIDPERTTSAELGVDAALWGGRGELQFTYYTMRSRVFRLTAGPPVGFPGIAYETGSIRNRGIEATLTGKVLTGPHGGWDVTLSLWGNQNRLIKFDGPTSFFGTWQSQRLVPAYPVGGYWARPIQSFADANRDGIIGPAEVVLGPSPVWAGTPYPTQGAILTSEWTWGSSFRAGLTLDYRAGQHLFNNVAYSRCLYQTCRAVNDPHTPLADQARAVVASNSPTTGYFEDADYLKLRELSLTWYAPPKVASALRARAATVSVAGRNLMTWSGYSGHDPEAGSYGVLGYGEPRIIADAATLPVPPSWSLRLQLTY